MKFYMYTTWLKSVLSQCTIEQIGQVGLPGLRVLCGTSHGIPVYHMVQMGWDGQVGLPGLRGTVWYVPWDPDVPHGTDGMGWTSRIKGYSMVRPMGSQCTTWYRWDGMDKCDYLA